MRLPRRGGIGDGARWGGEVAAAKLTKYLKPATGTIYLEPAKARDTLATLVQEHRLRADPQGNVEILDAFWKLPELPKEDMPRDLVRPCWSTPISWPRSTRAISRSPSGSVSYTSSMLSVARERPVDPLAIGILKQVDPVARALGIEYLVTGATARDILLVGVFGLETGRGTGSRLPD